MTMINITFEHRQQRFLLHGVRFVDNAIMRGIPGARFSKRHNAWVVPARRHSAKKLLSRFGRQCTPEIRSIMESSAERHIPTRVDFPDDYEFKTTPFDHQRRALDATWGLDTFAYFMEMGTGKTKTAIDYYSCAIHEGRIESLVVLAPNAVLLNWEREFEIHGPDYIELPAIHRMRPGAKGIREAEAAMREPSILVVGMEAISNPKSAASRFMLEALSKPNTGLCVDESHNFKNHKSARTERVIEQAHNSVVRNLMTGTSISQGPLDLYGQFEILDPAILGFGDYYSFQAYYSIKGGFEGRQVLAYDNLDNLYDDIAPWVFQCTKAEALDLPDKTYAVREVELVPEQAKLIKTIKRDMEIRESVLDGRGDSVDVEMELEYMVSAHTKMATISSGFFYEHEDVVMGERDNGEPIIKRVKHLRQWGERGWAKVEEMLNVVGEDPERPAVVWTRWVPELLRAHERLVEIYGDEHVALYRGDEKDAARDRFEAGEAKIFLSTVQSGGTGINLVQADLSVYLANSFRYVDRIQSEDRTHRHGQKSDRCHYVDIIAAGTGDAAVLRCLSNKEDLADHLKAGLTARIEG